MLKNRIVYIAIFSASAYFVYIYGGMLPWLLFEFVAAAPVISLLYLLFCFISIGCRQKLECDTVEKYGEAVLNVRLWNCFILSVPLVRVRFMRSNVAFTQVSETEIASLGPLEERTVRLTAKCMLCGTFRLGVQWIEFYDVLGIFRLSRRLKNPTEITVTPRVLDMSCSAAYRDNGVSLALRSGMNYDPLEYNDIREYMSGDNMRSIHWKASVKKNQLMVKDNRVPDEVHATVLCDCNFAGRGLDDTMKLRDRLIEYAVMLADDCLSKHYEVDFACTGAEVPVLIHLRSAADYPLVAEAVCAPRSEPAPDAPALLGQVLQSTDRSRMLLFVSAEHSTKLDEALLAACMWKVPVTLYDADQPLPGENGDYEEPAASKKSRRAEKRRQAERSGEHVKAGAAALVNQSKAG